MTTPNNICVYHKGCIDGMMAAFVFNKHLPDTTFLAGEYSSASHANTLHITLKESFKESSRVDLYLVDFSYQPTFVSSLLETYPNLRVTIIDHHKTAIAALGPLREDLKASNRNDLLDRLVLFLSSDHSGASLTHLWFDSKNPPHALVRFVEDYDLWRHTSKHTFNIIEALYSLGSEPYVLQETFNAWEAYYVQGANTSDIKDISGYSLLQVLGERGQILTESRRKRARFLCTPDKIQKVVIDGYTVPLVQAPHELAAIIGEELGLFHPFVAVNYIENYKNKYSLRANTKSPYWTDVEVIASKFGGGGHASAAGFTLPLTTPVFDSKPKFKIPKFLLGISIPLTVIVGVCVLYWISNHG